MLRWRPLVQFPLLLTATLVGLLLVAHATQLQRQEMAWLQASALHLPLRGTGPGLLVLPDPQVRDLESRWLALQAVRSDSAKEQIGLLRRSLEVAQQHLQARPQWSMAWLNWARISAQLYPAGSEWQAALRQAMSLGDRGWAFQRLLAEFMFRHESFMDPQTREAVERSLLSGMAEDFDLAAELQRQGLMSALCTAPVSAEAKRSCVAGVESR